MTNIKEILKNRTVVQMFGKDFVEGANVELKFAEEQIEKQIPKKAYVEDGESWTCPTCDIAFCEMYEWSYCPNCGQKLLWEV